MSHPETESKITMACPSGHRVRGGVEMLGRTVRCPKCQVQFLFSPESKRTTPTVESRKMTDTGVMRILGDCSQMPEAAASTEATLRPCSRCGVAIPEALTVCSHCNCYVGVMPSFMKHMSGNIPQRN